jgi:hypothetical protein
MRRQPSQFGVIDVMTAGCREDWDLVTGRKLRQASQVAQDLGRAWHVKQPGRFQEVALSVDVDKHPGTIPHEMVAPK